MTYAARAKKATAITRSVPFSQRSGSRRVNCQATAAAEATSIVESRPNAIRAPEDATVPAAIATTASIRL
ncbi:hypothetical protein D3C86_2232180 [compost metagenome]